MYTYTVTIGRNRNDGGCLTLKEWESFQEYARDCLEYFAKGFYVDALEVATGVGEWDGVKEENAVITLRTDAKPEVEAGRWDDLKLNLKLAAKFNHQDAVALSVGESTLIESSKG